MATEKELLEKLEEANEKLNTAAEEQKKLKKELENLKRYHATYEMGKATGEEITALLKGLCEGGLTLDQAFELVKIGVASNVARPTHFTGGCRL